MTNDVPRLSAQAAWSLRALKTTNTASSARGNASLRNRREIEPVRNALVAERRPLHPPDERLDTFCNS